MKPRHRRHGRVLVHTGEGKGKSSAAFGVVFRAAGWGMQVCVIQFIKGRWQTGEQRAAARFDNIEWHVKGEGFTWDTKNPARDRAVAREAWRFSQEKIISERYDLVVLDEINYCCGYGWLDGAEIAAFVRERRPAWLHLILTGRNAPPEVIEVADTVTEMRLVKHAYRQGIDAEQGVEF